MKNLLVPLAALSLPLAAQEARILRQAGDSLGPANLVGFELLSAEQLASTPSRGSVLVRADTDAPDATDEFLLRLEREEFSGNLTVVTELREGDPEPGFPSAPLVAFPDADLTVPGARVQILVSGAAPFTSTQLYWNTTAVARNGGTVALPGNTGPNRLVHTRFRHARANDARRLLVASDIWPQFVDTVTPYPVLLRYQLDPAGAVTGCEIVLDAGGNRPFASTPYDELALDARATGFDAACGWLTRAHGLDGRWRVLRNGVELAVESGPAPLAGHVWSALGADQPVALSVSGGYAYLGSVDGDPAQARVLVQDGAVLAREGEVLPALAPRTLHPRADTNLAYTSDGAVLWLADLSGGGQALLRGREVLLASGATIESVPLLGLEDFVSAEGGRFVFLDAVLATGPALVRLDLGTAEIVQPCATPNAGSLRRTGGAVTVGGRFDLTLDAPLAPGALAYLRLSAFGGSCEASTPFGEVYVNTTTTLAQYALGLHHGQPFEAAFLVPPDLGLLGAEAYGQGFFVARSGPAPRIVLTNGLRFEVGAP